MILPNATALPPLLQSPLAEQINAVDAFQTEQELRQQAAQEAQAHRIAQQQAAEAARQQRREAEKLAAKKHEESYEDKLRDLDLQEKSLRLEAEKARVGRSNDYIDQELKEKAAETDVIKAQADSNRNVSEGTKALLEKTGDAEVKKETGLFDR